METRTEYKSNKLGNVLSVGGALAAGAVILWATGEMCDCNYIDLLCSPEDGVDGPFFKVYTIFHETCLGCVGKGLYDTWK